MLAIETEEVWREVKTSRIITVDGEDTPVLPGSPPSLRPLVCYF